MEGVEPVHIGREFGRGRRLLWTVVALRRLRPGFRRRRFLAQFLGCSFLLKLFIHFLHQGGAEKRTQQQLAGFTPANSTKLTKPMYQHMYVRSIQNAKQNTAFTALMLYYENSLSFNI